MRNRAKLILRLIGAVVFILVCLCYPGERLKAEGPEKVRVYFNGRELFFPAPVVVEEGRALVPARFLLESMGAKVAWEEKGQRVYASLEGLNLLLPVGARVLYINNLAVPLDTPAKIIDGRVYLPLRALGEALGAEIRWDGSERTIIITLEKTSFDPALVSRDIPDYYGELDFKIETYGVKLGDNPEKVRELLGEPVRREATIYGYSWWVYNRDPFNYLLLGIGNDRVVCLYTCGEQWSFGPLKPGSPLSDLEKFFVPAESLYVEEQWTIYRLHLPALIYEHMMVTFYYDALEKNKITALRLEDLEIAKSRYTLFFRYRSAQGEGKAYDDPQRLREAEAAEERLLFDLANAERARRGLAPLFWHQPAAEAALRHSREMFLHDYFSHVSPVTGKTLDRRLDELGIDFRLAAENIARGQLDAVEVHHGLMNSAGHRKNILNEELRSLGVGVYRDCYTQNFVTERHPL